MQAIWKNKVIAEADKADLIYIEGNWYFPPSSIKKEHYSTSDYHTTCYWKGEANYYNITVDSDLNENGAWYYPTPKDGSIERVKKDFSNYVAFWNGIVVAE